jgi:magnesium transporter
MVDGQKQLFETIEDLLDADNREQLSELLCGQRSSDIGEVIELLENDERRIVFDLLDREVAADVLEKVDEATRSELFDIFGEKELLGLISELDPDDAADLLAELPEDESEDLLERMEVAEADQIKDLMSYSEDSAGGIMDPILVKVYEDATIGEAIRNIQEAELDEDFFCVFVVDKNGKLCGEIHLTSLLRKNENSAITDIIDTDVIPVYVSDDQEHVRNIFSKNDLIVVPVLDENKCLIGRITADRVIEVAEEEAAEDVYAMAGTDAAELESFSPAHAARVRMTWLLPCLVGTGVTAIVLLLFRNVFAQADFLAIYFTAVLFSPMICAISGNAGLQTSAIVVCGLATGDLAALRISQVFSREVRIALFVAISCGLIGGSVCGVLSNIIESDTEEIIQITIQEQIQLAAAFGTAMFSAIMVATTLGLFLPFLFRRIGIDPAISSGPLVTTANDAISAAIYLTLVLVLSTVFH